MGHRPIKARLSWKNIVMCCSRLVAASHVLPSLSILVFKSRKLFKPKIRQPVQKTTLQCE